MEENKTKPTIEDVAKHCRVSIATVSRVINQSSPVSENLTLRVRKAIKELGFTPRQWKDAPITKTIVITIPDVLNPYYAAIINGAQNEADKQGLALIFQNISENPERQQQHLNMIARWLVDGLIVMGTKLPAEQLIAIREQYNIPIVVSRTTEIPEFPCIIPNYRTAAYHAAKYLISLNHKRIAYISGPQDWVSSAIRLESIRQALSEVGLSFPGKLYQWCYPDIEESIQAVNKLISLSGNEPPTAIMTFNDLIALGALRVLHTRGLRVPEDVSVIGFDDIPMAAYTIPSLTTIAQPAYRIGQLCVNRLNDIMQDNTVARRGTVMLECPLILRESTGPCPS